jgi:hypothetical protein
MAPLADPAKDQARAGLCFDCFHARRIESARGSLFFLCQLSLTDSRFRKYPSLPVFSCAGFRPGSRELPGSSSP